MAGYYRNFIKNFATIAAPLTDLTKLREPFRWGPEQQRAFDILKHALVTAPILAHPDVSRPYILYTDASDKAIGAILVQKDDEGIERVISYLSHKFPERNCDTRQLRRRLTQSSIL
jgi:phospholipid-translocating ATPase